MFKRVWFWILVVLVLGGIGAYFAFGRGGDEQEIVTALVEKGSLVQTVEASGFVESDREVELAFESSGIVSEVFFEEGDEVKAGDVIMSLASAEATLGLAQAQAGLEAAQGSLAQTLAGESTLSVAVYEARLAEAEALLTKYQNDLETAENNLTNTTAQFNANVTTAEANFASAADALANTLDQNEQNLEQVYDDSTTAMKSAAITASSAMTEMDLVLGIDDEHINNDFEYLLSMLNEQSLVNAQKSYPAASKSLADIEDELDGLAADSEDDEIETAVADAIDMLAIVAQALEDTRDVLNYTISGSVDLTAAELAAFKSSIDASRSAVNAETTALQNQQQLIDSTQLTAKTAEDSARNAYDAAASTLNEAGTGETSQVDQAEAAVASAELLVSVQEATVETARASLSLAQSGPRAVDTAALEAQVRQAEASLGIANEQYRKTQITAPFDGQLTDLHLEVGEHATAGVTAAQMLAAGEYQILADVDEADIVKVELNDEVDVTFDAFGDDIIFAGRVAKINPAEKNIEGLVLYQITVYLDEAVSGIRSGMSADTTIFTERLNDVLTVPNRAILTENLVKYLRILDNGDIRQREVTVGIRGDMGQTEIVSGVKEGEEIVVTIRDQK